MAFPPASSPAVWDELLSSTMHNIRGKFTDNIFKSRPTLEHLLSNGRVRIEDGGISIVEPLLYAEGNADTYGEWDVITVRPVNSLTAAQYPWKQFYATIAISGLEEAQNSGRNARINLIDTKVEQAEQTMRSKLNKMVLGTYSSATPANDFYSLGTIIDNTTPVGGINPADVGAEFWKSYEAAVGAVDAAGLETAFRTAMMSVSDNGGDEPDLLVAAPDVYAFYESTLTPQVRYTDTNKANLGFRNLLFENAPMVWDADMPAGTVYGINSKYVGLVIHRDRNFEQSPFSASMVGPVGTLATPAQAGVGLPSAETIDARVSFITTYGNLTTRNRRRLFKLTGITKAP